MVFGGKGEGKGARMTFPSRRERSVVLGATICSYTMVFQVKELSLRSRCTYPHHLALHYASSPQDIVSPLGWVKGRPMPSPGHPEGRLVSAHPHSKTKTRRDPRHSSQAALHTCICLPTCSGAVYGLCSSVSSWICPSLPSLRLEIERQERESGSRVEALCFHEEEETQTAIHPLAR